MESERTKEEGGRKRSLKVKSSVDGGEGNGPKAPANPMVKDELKIKEMLASKIARLQIGDESMDVEMDGIFSDGKFVEKSVQAWQESLESGEILRMETTVGELLSHLAALHKKVGELHAKYIITREEITTSQESCQKVITTKNKLEQLCRELQKQNKTIIAESRKMAEDEDAKRKQLSQQFQTTIDEVSVKMEQQGKDYVASLHENESLQNKLKAFLAQYEVREEHFSHQLQAKDLTIQLAEAKLKHQIELTKRESEKVELTLEKAQQIAAREVALQEQLSAYSEKFDTVQDTLSKSNTMFVTLRTEMDKMSKHIKRLEKDNAALKKKCDQYDSGAIEALQERVRSTEDARRQQGKINKLEALCRVLQEERKRLKESVTPTEPTEAPLEMTCAGPNALALVLSLMEEDRASEFTENESIKLSFWRSRLVKSKLKLKLQNIRVLDPSGTWCNCWNNNFELFGISHLRSPLNVHLDPLRPEGLRDFATATNQLSSQVIDPPTSIPFNKKNRAFATNTSMFSENDRSFFGCPSQKLFAQFHTRLAKDYNISSLVEKEKVCTISPIFDSTNKTPSSYKLQCESGQVIMAAKVVVAIGTQNIPRLPQWSIPYRNAHRVYHSSDLVAQGLRTVQRRYKATKPRVLIVGGGLTSVHLTKQSLQWGARHVTLLTRKKNLLVQPYDVPLEWLSPTLRDKMRADFFADMNPLTRLHKIKDARRGGSVTRAALNQMYSIANPNNFNHLGDATIQHLEQFDDHIRVKLSTGITLDIDEIILATGSDVNIKQEPLFKELLPHGVKTTEGLPLIDDDLRLIPSMNVFVMGGYAALRHGPTAGNLMGARAGANLLSELLVGDLTTIEQLETHHHMRFLCGKENMYELLQ
ncbi:hypothetical protein THRCLA_20609 [Thraustotheca clavata]|uniref:FAD/NAD(P)-binding domain-containing protein n=1 Tax=Thraustotheca clavata TaxID=74557 RepID=A0A1W0A5H4_9STRA|nr:hypothetical protein THRCLA_20609 [Thraustotheca clavata]